MLQYGGFVIITELRVSNNHIIIPTNKNIITLDIYSIVKVPKNSLNYKKRIRKLLMMIEKRKVEELHYMKQC